MLIPYLHRHTTREDSVNELQIMPGPRHRSLTPWSMEQMLGDSDSVFSAD